MIWRVCLKYLDFSGSIVSIFQLITFLKIKKKSNTIWYDVVHTILMWKIQQLCGFFQGKNRRKKWIHLTWQKLVPVIYSPMPSCVSDNAIHKSKASLAWPPTTPSVCKNLSKIEKIMNWSGFEEKNLEETLLPGGLKNTSKRAGFSCKREQSWFSNMTRCVSDSLHITSPSK